jgi:sugar phosphate isomerase/epimerase
MKKRTLKYLLIILLMIPVSTLTAQEIGIQMGSMRKMYADGMPTVIAKLKELGITEIEGGGGRSMDRASFRKLAEENSMKIIATGGGNFDNLQNKDSLQKVITNAKELGAQNVICYSIPHDGDNFTYANMQKAVEVFNAAGKTLKENGLSFWYHPHGYEFREYPEGKGTLFEYMMEKTNPEYVNFQMDVFWIKNPGQDPVALLKKYPTRWKSLHLKDRRIGTPNNPNGRQDKETNVVLGTGDVGIAEVMKTAKKIGIKHYFIEDESSRALEQVPASVAYLKALK